MSSEDIDFILHTIPRVVGAPRQHYLHSGKDATRSENRPSTHAGHRDGEHDVAGDESRLTKVLRGTEVYIRLRSTTVKSEAKSQPEP